VPTLPCFDPTILVRVLTTLPLVAVIVCRDIRHRIDRKSQVQCHRYDTPPAC